MLYARPSAASPREAQATLLRQGLDLEAQDQRAQELNMGQQCQSSARLNMIPKTLTA